MAEEYTDKNYYLCIDNDKDGNLYPPMVENFEGAPTEVGLFLDADAGTWNGRSKTGRAQVKSKGGGSLSYRPAWHLGYKPEAKQFYGRGENEGKAKGDIVWALVEFDATNDYSLEADAYGINKNGAWQHSMTGVPFIPENGFYEMRTNPNPSTDALALSGSMRVVRMLSRGDEASILAKSGVKKPELYTKDMLSDEMVERINRRINDNLLANMSGEEYIRLKDSVDKAMQMSFEELHDFTYEDKESSYEGKKRVPTLQEWRKVRSDEEAERSFRYNMIIQKGGEEAEQLRQMIAEQKRLYTEQNAEADAAREKVIAKERKAKQMEMKAWFEEVSSRLKVMDNAELHERMSVREPEPEADNIVLDKKGEFVSSTNSETGQALFSLRSYEEGGREHLRQFLERQRHKGMLTNDDAREIYDAMDNIYRQAKEMYESGEYNSFNEWSVSPIKTTKDGAVLYSVIKPNAEYGMNLDFSLICKKRRTLDQVLNVMAKRGMIDMFTGKSDDLSIAVINDVIRAYGLETACKLCFVDAKRFRQAKVADAFVDMYNGLVKSMIRRGSKLKANYFDFAGEGHQAVDDAVALDKAAPEDVSTFKLDRVMKTHRPSTVMYKIARYLKENPDERRLLQRSDFMGSYGFDRMTKHSKEKGAEIDARRKANGEESEEKSIRGLYNSKKGAGGPKSSESDIQYLNDVAKAGWNPQKAFAVGGVRVQSFSDFIPHMAFDYAQMFAELAAAGLPAHAYTKEELFVKMFGKTGIKINMSLVPKVVDDGVAPGLDAKGNYVWDINRDADGKIIQAESFDYDEAVRIQNDPAYRNNCGTIAVGVSDAHIRKMMADPNIRMIIPYHKSGINALVAKHNGINRFVDYTKVQSTRYAATGKNLSKADHAKELNFNEYLKQEGDPTKAVDAYLADCARQGWIPKFDQFLEKSYSPSGKYKDAKGRYDYKQTEGYYKLLEDYTTYIPDGKGGFEYHPQEALRFDLPTKKDTFGSFADLMRRGLAEEETVDAWRDHNLEPIIKEVERRLVETNNVPPKGSKGVRGSERSEQVVPAIREGEDLLEYSARLKEWREDKGNVIKTDEAQPKLAALDGVGDSPAIEPGESLLDYSARLKEWREANKTAAEGGGRYSSRIDAEYLAAVEAGDMQKAQEMVNEAAKRAMPETVVVDEDGKPKVVKHGTPHNFTVFDENKIGSETDNGWLGRGFYFYANNDVYADQYSKGGRVINAYLDIREPYYATVEDMDRLAEANSPEASREFTERLIDEGYDGVYYNGDLNGEWVAFYPHQIKSADPVTYDNNGNVIPLSERFNVGNSDIRYSIAGERGAAALDKAEEATVRMDNLGVAREMEEAGKDAKAIRLATGWERGADGKWRYEIEDGASKTKYFSVDFTGQFATELKDIWDDDSLYLAYPQLKDLTVVGRAANGITGYYSGTYRWLQIAKQYFDAVADFPLNTRIQLEELKKRMDQADAEIEKKYGNLSNDEFFKVWEKETEHLYEERKRIIDESNGEREIRYYFNPAYEDVLAHEIQHAIQDIEGFARGGDTSNGYDFYHRLGGEVESRNVQNRINMTPEQRRETLLAETEDVAREDQIFLRDNVGKSEMAYPYKYDTVEYDKENGTQLTRFVEYLRRGKTLLEGESPFFPIAKSGPTLNYFGIKGMITPSVKTFTKRHSDDHKITEKEWKKIAIAINNPLYITQTDAHKDKEYRVYTPIQRGDEVILVALRIKQQGRDLFVADVKTAFPRNLSKIKSNNENVIYDRKKDKQRILKESSLGQSPEYISDESIAYNGKGTNNSAGMQENVSKNILKSDNGAGLPYMADRGGDIAGRGGDGVEGSERGSLRQLKGETDEQFAQRKADAVTSQQMNLDNEQARKVVTQQIKQMIDSKMATNMVKSDLNRLLARVNNATPENVMQVLRKVQDDVRDIQTRMLGQKLHNLLKLKTQDRNGKNMSVAKNVSNDVRVILDNVKGRMYGVMVTDADEAMGLLRSENRRLQEENRRTSLIMQREGWAPGSADHKAAMEAMAKANATIAENNKRIKGLEADKDRTIAENLSFQGGDIQKQIDDKMQYMQECVEPDSGKHWTHEDSQELTTLEILQARMDIENTDQEIRNWEKQRAGAGAAQRRAFDTLLVKNGSMINLTVNLNQFYA